MSPELESESKKWWQTLPGLLTAAAGIITAFTGLLLAVHQIGCFERSPASQVQYHPTEDASGPSQVESSTARPATSSIASRQLVLPANSQMRTDESVYQLVSGRLEPYAPGKASIHLTVRMTNNGRFDANFWAASFRLLVDGGLQAPTNNLDEVVASHSSKEGDIEFVIPANVPSVGLQMGDVGERKPTLTLNLNHE
jgi:hypothetical protein